MPIVLIRWGSDAFPVVSLDPFPSTVGIPHLSPKTLTLDDIDLEETINQQVIDLRNSILPYYAEIVNNHPIGMVPISPLDPR